MAEITDVLETVLRLTGVEQYQQQMRAITGSTEAFAAAEATALDGLAGIATGFIGTLAPLALARRGLDAINEAFKQFAEDDAIARRVGFALHQIGSNVPLQAFQDLSETLSNVTGIDDELILQQAEILSRFRLTGQQIQQIIPLIVDVAARESKDLDTVSTAVGRALLGQQRGLQALGIQFKRTGDTAKDFAAILKQFEQFRGAAALLGQTPSGQLQGQATAEENLRSAIGRRFAPAEQQVIGTRNRFLNFLTRQAESGNLDAILGTELARTLSGASAAEAGRLAANRVRASRGLPPLPDPNAAADAAIQGNPSQVQRTLENIDQNTKNTHRALLRGGSPAAQGAVSVRELNQVLGVR